MMTGGVGVMNVMLTSVRERRREIGIRKALGARDREIFAQFFCEAALYGALGAAAGSAMGFLLTYAGESIVGVPAPMQGWRWAFPAASVRSAVYAPLCARRRSHR